MNVFARNLDRLCVEMNINSKEIADKLGVGTGIVNYYRSGKRTPSRERKLKLSEMFGVNLDELAFNIEHHRDVINTGIESIYLYEVLGIEGTTLEEVENSILKLNTGQLRMLDKHVILYVGISDLQASLIETYNALSIPGRHRFRELMFKGGASIESTISEIEHVIKLNELKESIIEYKSDEESSEDVRIGIVKGIINKLQHKLDKVDKTDIRSLIRRLRVGVALDREDVDILIATTIMSKEYENLFITMVQLLGSSSEYIYLR